MKIYTGKYSILKTLLTKISVSLRCWNDSSGELFGWWESHRVCNTELLLPWERVGSCLGVLTPFGCNGICHLPLMLSGAERSLYEHHHTELFWWFRKQSAPCGWILCWLSGGSVWHRIIFFPVLSDVLGYLAVLLCEAGAAVFQSCLST